MLHGNSEWPKQWPKEWPKLGVIIQTGLNRITQQDVHTCMKVIARSLLIMHIRPYRTRIILFYIDDITNLVPCFPIELILYG